MTLDPRAPVVVGVGAVTQHVDNAKDGLDAFELVALAVERAGADTGAPEVLSRIDLVAMPRGTWNYRDPGRVLAERFGASSVRTIVAEIGVLQQTMLTRAAQAIAAGDADVVLVCGVEAKHRALLAAKAGIELDDPDPSHTDPDEAHEPVGGLHSILTMTEIERDLAAPTHEYALIESAIAHVEHRTPVEQNRHVADLWARFARVAAENPDAWDRRGLDADQIGTATRDNRAIATPYTKLLCSQWNVDQAAAIVMVAAETAAALGIASDRQVFAHSAAESNQMVQLPLRDEIHRWPAFETVVAALGLPGDEATRPTIVDLYSCFPAAVQVQTRALGYPLDAPLTVSGGMTFGGGPLNHSALQAMVPFIGRLRAAPDERGLITSVSGMLTKPGASLWSATPPGPAGFESWDVTAEATTATVIHPLLPNAVGPATIAAHTVVHDGGVPARAVAVLDVDGGRTIARCSEPDVLSALTESDWVGRPVTVVVPGAFVVD